MATPLEVVEFWATPLLMVSISTVYFLSSPKTQPLSRRVLTAGHGALGALLFAIAMAVHYMGSPRPGLQAPFLVLWALPFVLAAISLRWFRGNWRVHILFLPLIPLMLWALIVSCTVIGGGK